MLMQIFVCLLQTPDPFFPTKYQVCILAISRMEVSDYKCLKHKFTSSCLYTLYATDIVASDMSSESESPIQQIHGYYHNT